MDYNGHTVVMGLECGGRGVGPHDGRGGCGGGVLVERRCGRRR